MQPLTKRLMAVIRRLLGSRAVVWAIVGVLILLIPLAMQFTDEVQLIISPEVSWGNAGGVGVFVVNSIFALLFAGSGLLFRRAAISNP